MTGTIASALPVYVTFVRDILMAGHVFVHLEVTWMGADRHTVKEKTNNNKQFVVLEGKRPSARVIGMRFHLAEQKQATSTPDWRWQ